eukprot:gene29775-38920_t
MHYPTAESFDAPFPSYLANLADDQATFAAFDEIGEYPLSHEVAPRLWVGAQGAAGILMPFENTSAARSHALDQLRALRISLIICCSDEEGEGAIFLNEGIQYVCAKLDDGNGEGKAASSQRFCDMLQKAIPLVQATQTQGNSVLVHCNSGCNRSASIAAAILMVQQRLRGPEGLAKVFRDMVQARVVMRPSFWPLLQSIEFGDWLNSLII